MDPRVGAFQPAHVSVSVSSMSRSASPTMLNASTASVMAAPAKAAGQGSPTRSLMPSRIIFPQLGVGGCAPRVDAATAANTMSADANATMAEGVRDVDAASNQAFGAAENSMDKVGKVADDAKDKAGQALKDTGNEIQD